MKRIAILSIVTVLSCQLQAQQNFRLTVNLSKDLDDTVFLHVGGTVFQSKVVNKKAVIEGHIKRPQQGLLMFSNKKCVERVYIEPAAITFTADVFKYNEMHCLRKKKVEGSRTEDISKAFDKAYQKIIRRFTEDAAIEKLQAMTAKLVAENNHSDLAFDLLHKTYDELGGEWALQTLKSIPYELDSVRYNEMLTQFNGAILLRVGNTIDFTQPDVDGAAFTLSSLKGKYVLLDFWASWCVPCRKENPKVKSMYEKYHHLGFEVVGVSLDTDAEKWKEAIEKDDLPWIHVSDLRGFDNNISRNLGIKAVPTTVLLDPEGRIIEVNLRGIFLEKEVAKLVNNKR